MQEFAPALFSAKVQNGRRTFFIDVKATKGEERPYLKITESSISKEGEKKKSYMTVFDNEINDFKQAIEQAVGFVEKNTK
ncbi:MAG: PUR family DNA/RNA-binding protein [Candidatus Doudnabacteria bacterium]|nr:PUR family DNA/RNA-binding protein [Candidatus Doudnabacteria bacterium]